MNSKVMLSLAMVALFTATASADTTSSIVTTEDWFTESVSGYEEGASLTSPRWTVGTTGASVENAGEISLDTDVNNPLIYTPAAWAGVEVSEYSFITELKGLVVYSASAPVLDPKPFGAIVAVTNNDGSASVWKWLDGDSWATATVGGAPVPVEGNTYFAKIEVRPAASSGSKVRYSVGTAVDSLVALTDWVDAGKNGSFNGLKYAGCATLGNIKGAVVSTVTVTIPASDSSFQKAVADLMGNAEINTSEAVVSALASTETLDNGLTPLQSIILGVNDKTAASKPYVAPVQNNQSGKLSFQLGNVDVAKYLGEGNKAKVKFSILESTDNNAWSETTENTGKNVASDGTATVTVPDGSVKYYKIKITIAD